MEVGSLAPPHNRLKIACNSSEHIIRFPLYKFIFMTYHTEMFINKNYNKSSTESDIWSTQRVNGIAQSNIRRAKSNIGRGPMLGYKIFDTWIALFLLDLIEHDKNG